MLFKYLAPLQSDCLVTSQCMQFILGDKREVHLLDESALPVTKKEKRGEGKTTIGLRHSLLCVYGQNDLRFACPCNLQGPA